jgi:hypothetical protein
VSNQGAPYTVQVERSINDLCSRLKLADVVRQKCLEISELAKPEHVGSGNEIMISESLANAIACAIVSMAHEEAFRMRRVSKHLPDRIIGREYQLSSVAIVRNKDLIKSTIIRKKADMKSNK